jgi:sugar phosphate isomerase/epimerase
VYKGQRDPGVRWSLRDFLRHLNEQHKGVEAISLETCFISERERKNLLSILKDINFEVSFAWGHPNGFMDVLIDDAVCEISEYIKLNSQLGRDRMRVAASSIAYRNYPRRAQIDLAIQSFQRIIPIAEHQNVKLALENHGDFYFDDIIAILEAVDSDYLGVTFDTGNSLRFKEDCVSSIKDYGKRVLIVHAKDVASEAGVAEDDVVAHLNCVAAGEGIVDFKNIFIELEKNQFDGPVLLEISRLHSTVDHMGETEILNQGLDYLHQVRRTLL